MSDLARKRKSNFIFSRFIGIRFAEFVYELRAKGILNTKEINDYEVEDVFGQLYASIPECGIEAVLGEDLKIEALWIYLSSYGNNKSLPGYNGPPLHPFEQNTITEKEVVQFFGLPHQRGGDGKRYYGIRSLPFIKYYFSDCQLRFKFENNKVSKISLLEPDWQPGDQGSQSR